MIKPIFIFSMPRSGSTLLQKILMGHNKISSHSEPWFLLNMASLIDYKNTKSDFSYRALRLAVEDMIDSLENKEKDLNRYIREFALSIYENLSDENSIYFYSDSVSEFFRILFYFLYIIMWRFRKTAEIPHHFLHLF